MSESVANFIVALIPFIIFVVISFFIWAIIDKHQNVASKFKRFLMWFFTVLLLPGIMSILLTNIHTSIWSPIHDYIVTILINWGGPKDEFEKHTDHLSDGTIQYCSPQYGLKIILPDKYRCKSYIQASEKDPTEKFELYYDEVELKIAIILSSCNYNAFQSIEDYYKYYQPIHINKPNIYDPLYKNENPPYCVFSYNFDDGESIYYELTYILDEVWCVTKFSYPTDNRECNSIVESYVKQAVLSNN